VSAVREGRHAGAVLTGRGALGLVEVFKNTAARSHKGNPCIGQ